MLDPIFGGSSSLACFSHLKPTNALANTNNTISLYLQVPKTLSEEDIFPIFEPFGPLKDLAVIRDKHTGLHRGCAFVTYWASADGERAQEALHDKFTFPGGRRPAQVKPAEPSGTGELH